MRYFLMFAALLTGVILFGDPAWAAGWGENASKMSDTLKTFKDTAIIAAVFMGVCCVIVGIIKFTRSSREEGGIKAALLWIVAGAFLISLPLFTDTTTQTLMQGTGNKL